MIALILAIDEQRGFAKNNQIPWHFPEDLKNFKAVTKDSVCIMGKQTYVDALRYVKPDKPFLPNRSSIVISSTLDASCLRAGVTKASDIESALNYARTIHPDKPIFFIGGKQIFDEGLSMATHVFLSKIPGDYDCDRFFDFGKDFNSKFELVERTLSAESGIEYCTFMKTNYKEQK